MIRLVYCSCSHGELSLIEIQRILEVARSNNADIDVTGMLAYEAPWFLQVLEGDRETVNELYLRIAEDPRHDECVLISYGEAEERLFGGWRMGFAGSSTAFAEALRRTGYDAFDPMQMKSDDALEFLRVLASATAEAA